MAIVKKLIKLAISTGLAFIISNTIVNLFMQQPETAATGEALKTPFTVIFIFAFYSACTLSAILMEKGFAVFSIISFPLNYAITGALGIGAYSVFVPASEGLESTEIGTVEGIIVIVLAAAAMLWAPIVDIIRLIRRSD